MEGNIILCGFMGSGKTSVGKRLAKKTGRVFCDTDRYLEKKSGMTVSQIFAEYGEARFREMEAQAVRELSGRNNMVIACGGGTVLQSGNVKAFRAGGGKILFLDVPLAALQERLKSDQKRPLLQKPNRREVIKKLYRERIGRYRRAADIRINAGAPTVVVVKRIIAKLGLSAEAAKKSGNS